MHKKIIFLLCMVFFVMTPVIQASSRPVTPAECYIYNAGNIQLGKSTSIENAYPVLGEMLSMTQGVPSEAYIPMYAICERGTIWLDDISGNATTETYARIMRVIFTKSDVYTMKGIHIGDDIQKVYKLYGYPLVSKQNKMPAYDGIVDHWDSYAPIGGRMEHLGFGSKNGKVVAIYISRTPGGL
ncbi:hypothetical protein [Selenomonas sp.]|uniref:hypothetical protein n=1 Tax=Selenomonas sp. TaxID=2053611 RepID=UPI0025F21BEC|nr:hypothetical protein [Selenomonas sp.]MCI6085161.1 hypothetical protein [Selenomonas sp.]MDY3297084.1 hypothetical protein [Selenomonas sp.]MDY4415643.1 hypothetical protein [Selenomonas sp.]